MAQKFITKNFLRYNYFPNSFKANNMTTEIIFHIQKNYKINLRFAPIGRQIINITENHTEAKRRWGLLIDADFYIENIPFNDSFDFFQDSKKYLLNDVCNFLNSF
ncbi:hypothetical protein D2962_09665 [Biomaibacter acetigenes]|uniref:Uncharacterized protein n=1 Tax=Biomaibacter acetigenes TaxID=2316383 RepID=A0A3G2R620_9FIRM|nr:hypothetical protein D2962_09665 [Biomaibacter acetigenes]